MSPRPDAERLCPRCAAWTSADDRFCALCGEALKGLGLRWVLEGKPVSARGLSFRTDRVPPLLKVEVVNKGYRSVVLPTLMAEPEVCLAHEDFLEDLEDEQPHVRLEGGASRQLDVVLDPEWLEEEPGKTRHVTLHLDGESPMEGRDGNLELTLFPKPEIKAELPPEDFHLHLGPQPAEPFAIVVRVAVGSARIVDDPKFTTGKEWFQVIRTEGERELEAGVKNSGFRILIQVLPSFLTNQLLDSDHQLIGNLELNWKDPADEEQTPFVVPFTVQVHRPPTLRLGIRRRGESKGGFGDQFTHKVTAGLRDDDLYLLLQNTGDEELLLGSLHYSVPWVSCSLASSAKLAPNSHLELPIAFSPSQEVSALSRTKVVIRVLSNDPCAPRDGSPLTILTDILPLKEHTASVVMDFGTTASVVGIVDSQIMLSDHSEAENGVVPTLVYYATRSEHYIGKTAKEQGILDHKSTQAHIKRDICSGRDRVIWYGRLNEEDWRSPELITQDYLEKFLLPVQNKLKGRIARLALTHPVTFSTRQIRTLSRIAQDVLHVDEADITTWPEPVAGSFDFIIKRVESNAQDDCESYHLLVYDFGGGTTDISLIKIEPKPNANSSQLYLSLQGITGDQQLGGKDLTDELITNQLGENTDINRRNGIFDLFDKAKILRSEVKSQRKAKYGEMIIDRMIIKESTGVVEFDAGQRFTIPFHILDNLSKVRIAASIEKARRLVGIKADDITKLIILPIGRSSAYPLVDEIIYETFAGESFPFDVEIKKLDYSDLKSCVTLGVCRLLTATPSPDLSGMHVSTRAIGWLNGQQNAFEEIIAIGTPLPLESNQEQFIWKRYPFSPNYPIIRISELPDSVPLPEELPDLIQPVYQDRATRQFSREELQGGLEVGAAYDFRGNLHLKLRAAGREVEVALDGITP